MICTSRWASSTPKVAAWEASHRELSIQEERHRLERLNLEAEVTRQYHRGGGRRLDHPSYAMLKRVKMTQDIMDGLQRRTPEEGTPQGAIICPLPSNIYLDPLEQEMTRNAYQMARYAHDYVILCHNQAGAEAALVEVQRWTAEAQRFL